MAYEELVKEISKNTAMAIPQGTPMAELEIQLSAYINQLIQKDFHKLIFILYRVDVSESKLKGLLQKNPSADTGRIIAALIIERQLQKIKTRRQFKQNKDDISEDEKW